MKKPTVRRKKQEEKFTPEIRLSKQVNKIPPPKPTVKEKKEQINEINEELEEEFLDETPVFIEPNVPRSFRYPLMRRAAPNIRIQPISTNLEIDLGSIPTNARNEENNDQYKPSPEKNYSLNQKYEIAGSGASYDSITPKPVTAPSPTLSPNLNEPMNAARGFGTQNQGTPGYPGQGGTERNYDSGLEQQTRRDRRRDM